MSVYLSYQNSTIWSYKASDVKSSENTEEWMGKLRIAVAECNYKEIDNERNNLFMA